MTAVSEKIVSFSEVIYLIRCHLLQYSKGLVIPHDE